MPFLEASENCTPSFSPLSLGLYFQRFLGTLRRTPDYLWEPGTGGTPRSWRGPDGHTRSRGLERPRDGLGVDRTRIPLGDEVLGRRTHERPVHRIETHHRNHPRTPHPQETRSPTWCFGLLSGSGSDSCRPTRNTSFCQGGPENSLSGFKGQVTTGPSRPPSHE